MIAVDFTDGQEVFPRLAEELADLDIGILGEQVLKINSFFLQFH